MTLEVLTKRIKTTTDLRDIVSTMKMLSSVSISPYEKALKSLDAYGETVKSAFSGLMKDDRFFYSAPKIKKQNPKTIAVIIGTDNGLVGRFNRDIVSFAKKDLQDKNLLSEASIICIGKRVGLLSESAKLKPTATYAIMNSLKEIAGISDVILMKVNDLIMHQKAEQVLVYHMHKQSGASAKPVRIQLMPLPQEEMQILKKEKWTGRTVPLITAEPDTLFQALIHEYLAVVLSRSLTASLAAEHHTRMVNMQQAEKNIDDSLEAMNLDYQQLRQTGITDELIDIVSGAESIKKKR